MTYYMVYDAASDHIMPCHRSNKSHSQPIYFFCYCLHFLCLPIFQWFLFCFLYFAYFHIMTRFNIIKCYGPAYYLILQNRLCDAISLLRKFERKQKSEIYSKCPYSNGKFLWQFTQNSWQPAVNESNRNFQLFLGAMHFRLAGYLVILFRTLILVCDKNI